MRKFASGVAVLLVGLGLQLVHFDQNEYAVLRAQSHSLNPRAYADNLAVVGIKWMFVAIPVVLLSVCLAFVLRTKVNQRRFEAVLAGIDELKGTGTIDGLTRQQIEDVLVVTGTTRDQLWGGVGVRSTRAPPDGDRRAGDVMPLRMREALTVRL